MKRTKIDFDIGTVPGVMRPYVEQATIYDSSCSEAAGKEIDAGVVRRLENFAADDVLIHGDYCLPNVILDRFSFRSFIDVGNGGVGDRHFDLYWGLWTLRYNLKTDRYHERFLDA